jgi:hypothetical protein
MLHNLWPGRPRNRAEWAHLRNIAVVVMVMTPIVLYCGASYWLQRASRTRPTH